MILIGIRIVGSRLAETFKERFVEWGLAGALLVWGNMVFRSPGLFDRPFYQPLESVAPQLWWAIGAQLIGLMSVLVLAINGAWQRTPMFRMAGCAFRLILWAGLCLGARGSPGIAYLGLLFALDTVCLLLAARDHGRMLSSRGAQRGNVS